MDTLDTGDFIILLLILLIIFFMLTKGLYEFNYDLNQSILDTLASLWDVDFKWFFRSTNSGTKGFGDFGGSFGGLNGLLTQSL